MAADVGGCPWWCLSAAQMLQSHLASSKHCRLSSCDVTCATFVRRTLKRSVELLLQTSQVLASQVFGFKDRKQSQQLKVLDL